VLAQLTILWLLAGLPVALITLEAAAQVVLELEPANP
jgi:hypothetical protein